MTCDSSFLMSLFLNGDYEVVADYTLEFPVKIAKDSCDNLWSFFTYYRNNQFVVFDGVFPPFLMGTHLFI